MVEEEVEPVAGLIDLGAQGVGALFADDAVGIFSLVHEDDFGDEIGREEGLNRLEGGFDAGVVGIEGEDQVLGVAFEEHGLLLGEGGALGGDGVGEAGGVAGDDVHLALAHEDVAELLDALSGEG